MARIDALTQSLILAGDLPMTLIAHYFADIEWDPQEREPTYIIHLGFIEVFIAGKKVVDLEGKEIPDAMGKMVMKAIPEIPRHELMDALDDEAEVSVFAREHAAGQV
jgi:hypothetical protein